tara:strand:+ start:977 stop:3733 length:2757 start_codon:yes stop_codon:yes gene_type:complete
MLLKNLINNPPKNFEKLDVKGLAINSKQVKKNFIFFALKGNNLNGEIFINEAIKNGAALIICSKKSKFKDKKVPIIKTKNVRVYLSEITSKFYKLKPKNMIAVTGTNGKTSVADFFYQILKKNNISVASIGTLGIKFKNSYINTGLTSPDIISLHKNLTKLKKNKVENVIIEASSHGLHQNRLDNLNFKAGIFTNFSQDHLDYHKTMKEYLRSKLTLFSKLLGKNKYIIADKTLKEYSTLKRISKNKKLRLLDADKTFHNIKNLSLPLIGSFQFKNLSKAILAAKLCNLSNDNINKSLKDIKNVEGRLNLIKKYPNNIKVFIDYAHTPDALSEVLKSIKNSDTNNISLVFGCGGERDFKKRPIMAKIAKSFCKKIYVTDDNPRNENPEKIRKEIIKNLFGCKFFNIADRSKAIKEAILNAEHNETILIAGKGHENYQDYGNKILKISDKEIIKNIDRKKLNKKKQSYLHYSRILNKIFNNKKIYKANGLSIDSRNLKKDNLFIAIKGKNNDGNKFVSASIKKGASYVVTSNNHKKYKNKILKVGNPIDFLRKFATLNRKSCNAKILAITGSTGKTSLKNILGLLLKEHNNTYSSLKSFNNHFGVPLSLSNLSPDNQFGIFEVGMSNSGEINKLSKMIKPEIAIITNIGEAHIENFDNIKGIAKAKSEIINNIKKNGTLIINRDDKFFNYLSKKAKKRKIKVISFGKSKKSDISLCKTETTGVYKKVSIRIKNQILELKIKDINIFNILASLAVLKELNLDLEKFKKVFQVLQPSEGRGRIYKIKRYKKSFKLIDESYNASPSSVKNALKSFSEIKKNKSKKYLFLGDMLELGKKSEFYHKKLSKLINKSDIDKVFVKGEKSLFTYKNLKKEKRGNIFQSNEDVDLILRNIIANNDYLMIKGSNATGLNEISKTMIKGF